MTNYILIVQFVHVEQYVWISVNHHVNLRHRLLRDRSGDRSGLEDVFS